MGQVSLRARVLFSHEPGAPRKILAVACSPKPVGREKTGKSGSLGCMGTFITLLALVTF
jgi:hypothetical protein